MTTKYYAGYDDQLKGYKGGFASTSYSDVEEALANRAYVLSLADEESCPENWTNKRINRWYGYSVREVTHGEYVKIITSPDGEILTTISGGNDKSSEI